MLITGYLIIFILKDISISRFLKVVTIMECLEKFRNNIARLILALMLYIDFYNFPIKNMINIQCHVRN